MATGIEKILEKTGLKSKDINDSISISKNENRIWQITKKYSYGSFDDTETSIGYAIDIYQESINKTFRDYFVNFNYWYNT